MKNFIKSIGGGNEIGASCHYLYCEGYSFMLDCGIRGVERRRYPSFSELLKLPTMDTLNDLDCVFISHGHYDHNGALPLLVSKLTGNKEIVCSDYTGDFTRIQLNILKKHMNMNSYSLYEDVMVDKAVGMLSTYPVGKKIEKNGYSFKFFRAGHISGAVMTLIEVNNKKILYTGDFSEKNYPMVEKYELPLIEDLDLLLVNGVNIWNKEDRWETTWGAGEKRLKEMVKTIILYKKINVEVQQVNNGIELAILLNNELEDSAFKRLGITIYVDEPIGKMLQVITGRSGESYPNIKIFSGKKLNPDEKAIYITFARYAIFKDVMKISVNYSLHESYAGIKELILKLKAKKTLVAHFAENKKENSSLLDDLKEEGYEKCEYIENDRIYEF